MSEISGKPHELCGVLGGVPLYHPTAPFTLGLGSDGETGVEFTPRNLLLGGGSGEHSILLFDIPTLAGDFILSQDEPLDDGETTARGYSSERIEKLDKLFEPHSLDPGQSERGDWGGNEWYDFITRAKQDFGFNQPYGIPEGQNYLPPIESWIADSLGEYVIVSMLDQLLPLFSEEGQELLRSYSADVAAFPKYCNVVGFPTGYERMGGCRKSLGDGNVRH